MSDQVSQSADGGVKTFASVVENQASYFKEEKNRENISAIVLFSSLFSFIFLGVRTVMIPDHARL